jgi:hypothetical protein
MFQLEGIRPTKKAGGITIEVHVDICRSHQEAAPLLAAYGLELHPFLVFYPAGYECHYTGRYVSTKAKLKNDLAVIRTLLEKLASELENLGIAAYIELEIVRGSWTIDPLDDEGDPLLGFSEAKGLPGEAKCDIHLKFLSGSVSDKTRAYLLGHGFYWVKTSGSSHNPGDEDIATLQVTSLGVGRKIFEALLAEPLPGARTCHLEQKVFMLPILGAEMPEGYQVTCATPL